MSRMDRAELERGVSALEEAHGSFFYDVPLPHGVWTGGNKGLPHTRLKRVAQVIADLVGKPLSECRILDLGCLEGQFAIEMALQGAAAVGIEIREANIEKARFIQEALELENVAFHQDDVRNISVAKYGQFDAIICSGILYHLPGQDAIDLIVKMHEMARRLVIIDTHIALAPERQHGEQWGRSYFEHQPDATTEQKAKARWASADNETSFWFTRPSLTNILTEAGFSSVYECFTPAHINYGKPGLESVDRCTFVALKAVRIELRTSPAANKLKESWPEGSLSYCPTPLRRMIRRIRGR